MAGGPVFWFSVVIGSVGSGDMAQSGDDLKPVAGRGHGDARRGNVHITPRPAATADDRQVMPVIAYLYRYRIGDDLGERDGTIYK